VPARARDGVVGVGATRDARHRAASPVGDGAVQLKAMKDVLIVSAARTPIGSFQGALASLSAPRLGAIAIKEALARAGIRADALGGIGEVYMGCVLPAGIGQAPARQASIGAGLPDKVGAVTINKVCGSG